MLPIDALCGRSPGGLAGQHLTFRPQLFWQEVLAEQAASSDLDFHCHMASGRNFARLPGAKEVASDGGFARSVARAVADDTVSADEARRVGRALREAATFAGDATPLRHLLSSCYCTHAALQPALLEASRNGHIEGVRLLLDAGASPSVQPQPEGKSALHAACEVGDEAVARALISADPASVHMISALGGRTPLDVCRDNDLSGLARRLEAHATECVSPPPSHPPPSHPPSPPSPSASSEEEEEEEEARCLRAQAHARRDERRRRWIEAADRLRETGWASLDDFLGEPAISALQAGVLALYRQAEGSPFVRGRTGGGRDGNSAKFAEAVIRGDLTAVLGEGERSTAGVPGLAELLRRADELVGAMAASDAVPELRGVTSRSQPMLACYPGKSARYVRHIDNPGGAADNGRLLTLLVYLNATWTSQDGGQLLLHPASGDSVEIEPVLDRAVLFWSDARMPHEVLPCERERWAVSVWYHSSAAGDDAAANVPGEGDGHHDPTTCGSDQELDMTEVSFGRTFEETEAFLLAMANLKDHEVGGAPPPAEHFRSNLRSW